MPYYRKKRDKNDGDLAKHARSLGVALLWCGEPFDYLVGVAGLWVPVDIKNLDGRARGRQALPGARFKNGREKTGEQLTPKQKAVQSIALAFDMPFWVWYTTEDVDRCVQAARASGRSGALEVMAAIWRSTESGGAGGGT